MALGVVLALACGDGLYYMYSEDASMKHQCCEIQCSVYIAIPIIKYNLVVIVDFGAFKTIADIQNSHLYKDPGIRSQNSYKVRTR